MKKLLLYFILFIPLWAISQIPSYYNDVNLNQTGQALKDELATKIITTHTTFLSYTPGVWDAIKQTDLDPNDNTKVLLIYGYNDNDGDSTTDRTRSVNMNGGNLGDWNREHVYAKSLGTPNLGTSGPGADAHHLRAADVQWNSIRSSRKFTDGSGNSGVVGDFWYPGDEWKGDVARMMMYMYLRYGNQCLPVNVGVGNSVATDPDMIDLFLQWNVEDPVSAFEEQRNPILETIQGNRNPFIDNPAFATQIWGGPQAEDRFGNAPSDTEAPTAPMNAIASNVTSSSVDLSWTASTDNIGVTGYDIYESGVYVTTVTAISYQVTGLTASTAYAFTIFAKDAAGNISTVSNTVNVTTSAPIIDTQAPTAPTNAVASNITSSSVDLSWIASTDNVGVTGYDIYESGVYVTTVATTSHQVTGLTASTVYAFTIFAKDAAGNTSVASNTVNVTTTASTGGTASELFISEYIEGSSNNKAIEIANFTGASVDLSVYSLKRNTNGGTTWGAAYALTGTVADQDVFVVANSSATAAILNVSDAVTGADALLFNGNDPVGLFKNDVLIDIVGPFNGGTANFAADTTLRRKSTVLEPSATYVASQWDSFPVDTFDGLGSHTVSGGADTQAPTAPTNLVASNITETTIDLSWTASTDNAGVTGYDVYVDGVLNISTPNTFATITGLVVNTTYSLTVYAKDAAGNISNASASINVATVDLTAPTAPTNGVASNITESTVDLSWTASTDNVGVAGYDVYESGVYLTTVTTTSYQIIGLTASTAYSFTIFAKDAAGNVSVSSNTINVTTNSGSGGTAGELFISEYVEGSSNNKAIEIANFTGASVDLAGYSLRRNTNGGTTWGAAYYLAGMVANQDVFVVANSSATAVILNVSDATTGADALLFNGNDPVGLFKNDVLIDIVGLFNGGSANFAADTTLRRKSTVLDPSATYVASQWDSFSIDTFDGLGSHTVSGGADAQVPTAPTNLAASNITETTVDLSWMASTDNVGVTEYDVYESGVYVTTVITTGYQVTGLTASTTYAFTIFAKDAAGNTSAASNTLNVTTNASQPTGPVVLHEGFFETGWDGWTDGGSDCSRYSGSRSFEGSFSILLRDNTGVSSSMTSQVFDLTSFDSVEIKFYFYSFSMETGEDFFVKYFDGSTWVDIANYVSGTDFNNDSFYVAALTLDSASYNLVSNAQFMIQCDASSNSDIIYIDQVTITGTTNAAAKTSVGKTNGSTKNSIELIGYKDTSFEGLSNTLLLYPNPVKSDILNIKTDSDFVKYHIFNVFGQSVKQGVLSNETIEVGTLKSGIYLIELSDGQDLITKKFVKQ